MSELDHWHPVLLSRELGAKPAGVKVCGQELVLFRTEHGVAALEDRCPHRGFPLHEGRVEGGRVVCPYHGWRWAADGRGESPANPRSKPCAVHFDCVERMGAVWVKRAGSEAAFPYVDVGGHTPVGTMRRRAKAPLELVLDNFIEVEHTPDVHAFLGYPAERIHEVECEVTATDESVRVVNHGPQRRLPYPLRRLFDIPDDAYFIDDWTARFSPVHAVYDQYFLDGARGPRKGEALRIAVFFTPVDERETDLLVFAYTNAARWERPLAAALRLPLVMALVRLEVERDRALLGRLAGAPLSLRNRALGRFDKALVASRKLLDRVYRGGGERKLRVVGES